METKKKWPNKERFKWNKHVVLTLKDGEKAEAIIARYECANISQLFKKIVCGELEIRVKQ